MSIHTASPDNEVLYQELTELLRKHAGSQTSLEMLAVASNMVGKIIALQDSMTISPKEAMAVVAQNIEIGNRQVVASMESRGFTSVGHYGRHNPGTRQ